VQDAAAIAAAAGTMSVAMEAQHAGNRVSGDDHVALPMLNTDAMNS